MSRLGAAAVAAASLPLLAGCDPAPRAPAADDKRVVQAPRARIEREVASFYQARGFRPLWVTNAGPRPKAHQLLRMLASADRDGLDPKRYDLPLLTSALADARLQPDALARADLLLSSSAARYAADLRRPGKAGDMLYVDAELAPREPTPVESLERAAAADSAERAIGVNPLYQGLRRGLDTPRGAAEQRLIRINMERARLIQPQGERYVIVDTAGAQLWLIENGKIRDRMRVIVGKPGQETPTMAGFIRFAVLNPYWNLPPDLARDRVARRVLRQGTGFIKRERLEILSDWSAAARPIHPGAVNWKAVAAGRLKLRVRQLPGSDNVMGAIKFMMPNRLGIYLHDTPNKAAFAAPDRRLSAGCVRVEDAERLARWLFAGKSPRPRGAEAEQRVDLPAPVPVYITYLTALPAADGRIHFQADVYGRDRALLAQGAAGAPQA